jgi:hypothetical protein
MKKILLTICCFVLMGGCSLSENFALVASDVEQEPEVQEYQRRQTEYKSKINRTRIVRPLRRLRRGQLLETKRNARERTRS